MPTERDEKLEAWWPLARWASPDNCSKRIASQHQCFLNTVQQPGLQDVTLFQFEPDECGKNQLVADYLQLGRDYFIAPRPNYQKFTYPHPLRRHSIR
jgi:hypothetical protein